MRRRLIEPAFIDGQMRPAGYEFEDSSAGPHRRNEGGGFAYHPQFVDIPAMNVNPVVARLRAKAIEARSVSGEIVKDVEGAFDDLLARRAPIKKQLAEAVAPHHEIFDGVVSEIEGVKSAVDLFSNGGPGLDDHPLPASAPAAPVSEAPKP